MCSDAPLVPPLLPARSSDPFEFTVQFGELTARPSFWNLQAYYNRYGVDHIFMSPGFKGDSPYDIALLKLSSAVRYTDNIQPVCLLPSTVRFENRTDCWVTGWGNVEENEGEAGGRVAREQPCPSLRAPWSLACLAGTTH